MQPPSQPAALGASTDSALQITFHECLGTGAFGEVYLASVCRDGEVPRRAAVKVLRLERQHQDDAVQRLKDEARMLAVLNHPAILRFHDFSRVEGRLVLVTEYVDGVDLDRFLDAEMPLRAALEVVAEVAGALQGALTTISPETGNPLGLIHRDVKPQNVRISRVGEVKLLDFGIARTSELARDAKTWAGDVVCTPGYASPEILCGDVAGPESDVYALGVVLFRLLAHAPFHMREDIPGQRRTAMLRKRYAAFLDERLGLLPDDLPDALRALLAGMVAHEPQDRPSAHAVQEEARRIASEVGGQSLREWAEARPPQSPVSAVGELVGVTMRSAPQREAASPAMPQPVEEDTLRPGPVHPQQPAQPSSRTWDLEKLAWAAVGVTLVAGVLWIVLR